MTPWLRMFLRAPIALYRIGLGPLLGRRFLLLQHTGRKTGATRRTVLEVVDYDRNTNTYFVAVGFGLRSDWFLNLRHNPRARIQIGFRAFDVTAHVLDVREGAERMCSYAQRHPRLAKMLAKFMGYEVDGSQADYAELPRLGLQFVALQVS